MTVGNPREMTGTVPGSSSSSIVLGPGRPGKTSKRQNQNGFSLIELLIVVAIILIIAAIAIPNLLHARIAANESSAASGIRTINTAEVTYWSNYQTYAAALVNLGLGGPVVPCPGAVPATACLIDGVLAAGVKSGYNYAATGTATTYNATASAQTLNTTGVKAFCSIPDAVVRFKNPGPIAPGACAETISPLL